MGAPMKSLVVELKKKAARAKLLLDFYNPDKYPASVLKYHQENWSLKIETVQIDLMEALFVITESVDGADDREDLVECEEIVKNISDEAVKFTIQFTQKLLSLTAESDLPPVAASDEARAAVIMDQDKLGNDLMDPVAETKKINFITDPEGEAEENYKFGLFGCEVKDSMKAHMVRLGDQAFVTSNKTFSGSFGLNSELSKMDLILGNMCELSAEGKFGYIGSCYTEPDLAIVDIVKPLNLITRSEVAVVVLLGAAMVSAAATHSDHTDRTGIGGECQYEDKLDGISGIALTKNLACFGNYYPVVVFSFKNVYSYRHLQVS